MVCGHGRSSQAPRGKVWWLGRGAAPLAGSAAQELNLPINNGIEGAGTILNASPLLSHGLKVSLLQIRLPNKRRLQSNGS